MIKNSIDLAQILAAICTETYTSTYYKLVEKIYTCLNTNNTLFIYVSPERYGVASDFQTKLYKNPKNAKYAQIVVCQEPFEFENCAYPEDMVLFLDKNEQILEIAKHYSINTASLCEHDLETDMCYKIPTQDTNRASEIQQFLLNDISENCLKFLS